MSVPLWKTLLRKNFTNWENLADYLELSPQQRLNILQRPRFTLNLPFRLAEKIAKSTLKDPILKQFLPVSDELISPPGYKKDPVGDSEVRKEARLLKKYPGRVLLLTTSACAMHCRHCFRQNFDYEIKPNNYHKELEAIQEDETIHEVILSGGDPLSLSDHVLKSLLQKLDAIPHVKRIRFHTRFPVGIPERIDASFLKMIEDLSKQVWFVLHVNHPKELDEELINRLKQLQKLGVVILNQAVLLREVNDDLDTLQELCEKLADHGILPYYLHQLDRVSGSSHFEVPIEEGKALIEKLTARLSGYTVPKYVQEIAGESSKTPL